MKNIRNIIIAILIITNIVSGFVGIITYQNANQKNKASIAFDDIRHANENSKELQIIDKNGNIYVMDK